jgi:heme exporter protein D
VIWLLLFVGVAFVVLLAISVHVRRKQEKLRLARIRQEKLRRERLRQARLRQLRG